MKKIILLKNTLLSLTLSILISACQHHSNSGCFKLFGGYILWSKNLSIKFSDKFRRSGYQSCKRNNEIEHLYLITNVVDNKINRKEGNTAVIRFDSFSYKAKLTSKAIKNTIKSLSMKYLNDVETLNHQDHRRFSKRHSRISNLTETNDHICQNVMTSVKDVGAANIPRNHEYLVQNDFYKTCYLKSYDQFITISISYRMAPNVEDSLWPEDFIKKINLLTDNVTLSDGTSLNNVIKINSNEIKNLKNYDTKT